MKTDADVFGADVMNRLAVKKRRVPTLNDPTVDDVSAQPDDGADASIQPMPKTASTTPSTTPATPPMSSTQPLSKAQLDGRAAPSDASFFGADTLNQLPKNTPSYNGNEGGSAVTTLGTPDATVPQAASSLSGLAGGVKDAVPKTFGEQGNTPASPDVKTGGFAAPAVLTDRTGAAPPGYDQSKWADKGHQSPKYSVGGIVADAIAKGARDMTPEILSKINEAYPGTKQVNGTTVNIPGIGEVQVINDGQVRWDPAGSFGPPPGSGTPPPPGGGPGIEDAYGVPQIKLPDSLTGGGAGAVPGYKPYVPDFSGLGNAAPAANPDTATNLGAPAAAGLNTVGVPTKQPGTGVGAPASAYDSANPDEANALGAPSAVPPGANLGAPIQKGVVNSSPTDPNQRPDTVDALGAPTGSPLGQPAVKPPTGATGTSDTAPPVGPPGVSPTKTPAQSAADDALAKILGGPSSEDIVNKIGSDPAVSAHRLAAKREFDKLRGQSAEDAALGGTASSGGFSGQLRGLGQAEAEGNAAFTGSRVADAVKERNQQLMQGIQIATASGDAEKARQLTLLMHDQDLKQNGEQFVKQLGFNYDNMNAQQKQAADRLAFDYDSLKSAKEQAAAALGFNYAQLNQQQKQFAAQLGQEDAHFGATLTQNQKQFLDSLGLSYAQLTSQQKLAIASLAQQNDQFNKTLALQYSGLESDANYKALLLALGGGK